MHETWVDDKLIKLVLHLWLHLLDSGAGLQTSAVNFLSSPAKPSSTPPKAPGLPCTDRYAMVCRLRSRSCLHQSLKQPRHPTSDVLSQAEQVCSAQLVMHTC